MHLLIIKRMSLSHYSPLQIINCGKLRTCLGKTLYIQVHGKSSFHDKFYDSCTFNLPPF